MSRYIDADALREHMYHEAFETDSGLQKWDSGLWIRYQLFESVLNTEITVDAEPIRHGRWIMEFDEKSQCTDWHCSDCGKHGRGDYKRCPWCGAKMEVTE